MYKVLYILLVLFIACKKSDPVYTPEPFTPPQELTGKTLSVSEIKGFKQLALGGDYGGAGYIKKWRPGKVYVYLADTIYSNINTELPEIISDLDSLVRPTIELVQTRDSAIANLVIYITDKQTYANAEPAAAPIVNSNNHGGVAYVAFGNYIVFRASVYIDKTIVADPRQQFYTKSLFRHEMMHTLGFLGHVLLPEFSNTIMSANPIVNQSIFYTEFDRKMIKLLYNPAMQSGMNEIQINPILKGL